MLCRRADGSNIAVGTLLLTAQGPPPRRSDRRTMCIAYHCHGVCDKQCSRRYDHRPGGSDQPTEVLEHRREWASKARGE